MKLNKAEERALALAGLVQSCYLVAGVARTGMASQDNLTGCLESIFVTNPNETLDVYKDGHGVRKGLRLVTEILGELNISEHRETIHYVLGVLSLERRLRQTPKLMRSLGAGISAIQEHRHLNELLQPMKTSSQDYPDSMKTPQAPCNPESESRDNRSTWPIP